MHHRECGAANVPVIVFLLTLILFFGALGFGYVVMEKNNELEQAITTAKADKKTAENKLFFISHYLKDITEEIGEPGAWEGRPGFDYSGYGIDPKAEALQNVAVPSLVKDRIAEFARTANVPATQGLASFFGHIKTSLDASVARASLMEGERDKAQTSAAELQTALDAAKSARDNEVAALNSQLSQKDQDFDSALSTKDELITKGAAALNQVRDDLTTTREDARVQAKDLTNEVEIRTARIQAIQAALSLVNRPDEADGQIIEASEAAGRAWVNIGRTDMLPVGTAFAIKAPDSAVVKARAVVARVQNDKAELRIVGQMDPHNPVVRGDSVFNDLYSPNLRRNIYLLGRFGDPSKPMIKRILENLGNSVHDTVGPDVDLVIVGKDVINQDGTGFTPITETAEYKEVLRLSIETATLNKVRDFLKLSN